MTTCIPAWRQRRLRGQARSDELAPCSDSGRGPRAVSPERSNRPGEAAGADEPVRPAADPDQHGLLGRARAVRADTGPGGHSVSRRCCDRSPGRTISFPRECVAPPTSREDHQHGSLTSEGSELPLPAVSEVRLSISPRTPGRRSSRSSCGAQSCTFLTWVKRSGRIGSSKTTGSRFTPPGPLSLHRAPLGRPRPRGLDGAGAQSGDVVWACDSTDRRTSCCQPRESQR